MCRSSQWPFRLRRRLKPYAPADPARIRGLSLLRMQLYGLADWKSALSGCVWQYQAVFTGVVTAINNPRMPVRQAGMPPPSFEAYPRQKIFLQVIRALTGLPAETKEIMIETGLGGGDCGYRFDRGVEYIVYAHGQPKGGLRTGICSPTRPVKDAAEDPKYFRQPQTQSPAVRSVLPRSTRTGVSDPLSRRRFPAFSERR